METTLRRSGRQHSAHAQARDDELSVQPLTERRQARADSPEMAVETAVTAPPIFVVSDTESEGYSPLAGTQQPTSLLLEPDLLLFKLGRQLWHPRPISLPR
jgi:hypothetical protein